MNERNAFEGNSCNCIDKVIKEFAVDRDRIDVVQQEFVKFNNIKLIKGHDNCQ